MAAQAAQRCLDLGDVRGIHDVRNGVILHWVAQAVLQRKDRYLILLVVIPGQFHFAAENCQHSALYRLRHRIGSVTLQAKRVALCPQQFRLIASMRLMTSGAALSKHGLVVHGLLSLFRQLGMAVEANIHRIGLRESRRFSSVWAVAIGAISQGAGVLHFGTLDLLRLFRVAGDANFLEGCLGQNHFSVFRCLVADFALFFAERQVNELLHQLRAIGLVRVVAGQAIRLLEWLILMRLCQVAVFHVVAIQAESRSRLGQVKFEFTLGTGAGLVIRVACIAASVECQVAAAFLRHVLSDRVATEAEVALLVSRSRLQQLELVIRTVWVVALQAVTYRWLVYCPLDVGRIFVGVAGEAKIQRRGRGQLDARDVFVDPNLVTDIAPERDRGVDGFPFRLGVVAFQAL